MCSEGRSSQQLERVIAVVYDAVQSQASQGRGEGGGSCGEFLQQTRCAPPSRQDLQRQPPPPTHRPCLLDSLRIIRRQPMWLWRRSTD